MTVNYLIDLAFRMSDCETSQEFFSNYQSTDSTLLVGDIQQRLRDTPLNLYFLLPSKILDVRSRTAVINQNFLLCAKSLLAFVFMAIGIPAPLILWKYGAKLRAMGKPQ